MKTRLFSLLGITLFLLAVTGRAFSEDSKNCGSCSKKDPVKTEQNTEMKPQTHCPVMGGLVNRETFTDYNGKRIYFCCKPCAEEFNKNPEKYIDKLEKEGITPEDAPRPSGA